MFRLFEKMLAMLVFLPPLYMVVRYLRWYARQHPSEIEENS